jgi:hypothetical protein
MDRAVSPASPTRSLSDLTITSGATFAQHPLDTSVTWPSHPRADLATLSMRRNATLCVIPRVPHPSRRSARTSRSPWVEATLKSAQPQPYGNLVARGVVENPGEKPPRIHRSRLSSTRRRRSLLRGKPCGLTDGANRGSSNPNAQTPQEEGCGCPNRSKAEAVQAVRYSVRGWRIATNQACRPGEG